MVTLSPKQAYAAMLMYLVDYYERGKSEEVAMMLAGMHFLADGETADPAAWVDWLIAVEKVSTAAQSPEAWTHFEKEYLLERLS
jgi:hypothetical protein